MPSGGETHNSFNIIVESDWMVGYTEEVGWMDRPQQSSRFINKTNTIAVHHFDSGITLSEQTPTL